jgi:hypothetical protein
VATPWQRRIHPFSRPWWAFTLLMWKSGASGLGVPGAGKTWTLIRARRANAVIAAPPSQQGSAGPVRTCPSAAVMLAPSSRGRTASMVAPMRSPATMTGICSADSLAWRPCRPLREALGRSRRLPGELKSPQLPVRARPHGCGRRPQRERGCTEASASPGVSTDPLYSHSFEARLPIA